MTETKKTGDAESFTPDLGTKPATTAATPLELTQPGDASRFTPELVVPERSTYFPYWIGLLPSAPYEAITLVGQSFPKLVKRRIYDIDASNRLDSGHVGAIAFVNLDFLERLCEVLPRKVVRWSGGRGPSTERGSGQILDGYGDGGPSMDTPPPPRGKKSHGEVITIHTAEQIAALKSHGRCYSEYVPLATDEHLSTYLFCVPAPGGDRAPGERPPPPVSVTGIDFPDAVDLKPMIPPMR